MSPAFSSLFRNLNSLLELFPASEIQKILYDHEKSFLLFSPYGPLWCVKLSEKYILKDSCKMKLRKVAYAHLCLSDCFVLSRDLFALLLGWLQIIPERRCKITRTNTSQCLSIYLPLSRYLPHTASACASRIWERFYDNYFYHTRFYETETAIITAQDLMKGKFAIAHARHKTLLK